MSKSYKSVMDDIKMSDELKNKIMKASAKGEKQKGKLVRPLYAGIASGLAASLVIVFALNHAHVSPLENTAQKETAQASELPESNAFELAQADETAINDARIIEEDTDTTADNGNKKTQHQASQATQENVKQQNTQTAKENSKQQNTQTAKENAKQQNTQVAKGSAEIQRKDTNSSNDASTIREASPATVDEENTASEEQTAEAEPEAIVVASAIIMSESEVQNEPAADEAASNTDTESVLRASVPKSGGGGGAAAAGSQPTEEPTEETE